MLTELLIMVAVVWPVWHQMEGLKKDLYLVNYQSYHPLSPSYLILGQWRGCKVDLLFLAVSVPQNSSKEVPLKSGGKGAYGLLPN